VKMYSISRIARVVGISLLLFGCAGGDERKRDYLENAQRHFDNGDMKKAAVDVRNSLQIDEEFLDARYLYAQILESQQNWQQVVANLRFIIDLDEGHAPARIKLGTIFLASEAYDEAINEAQRVIETNPENAEAHALLAAVSFRQGKIDEAITLAETSLSYEEGNVSAIAVLTEIYKTENPLLALEIIENGISKDSGNAVFFMMQISVYEQERNFEKVAEIYQHLIDNNADNLFYYERYVNVLERQGKHENALKLLSEAVHANQDNVEVKLWLVRYLVKHRDLEQAESHLREFSNSHPNTPDLALGLGELMVAQGRTDDAREHYLNLSGNGENTESAQKARFALFGLELREGNDAAAEQIIDQILRIEPENPDALTVRANQALFTKDYSEAIAKARAVLLSRPNDVPALEILAASHEGAKQPELALDNYRQMLEADPQNIKALVKLSQAAARNGELEQAESLASTALKLAPESIDAARTLVGIYAQQGDIDGAIGQANQLASSEENATLGKFLLARIYQADRDFGAAIQNYKAVLEQRPENQPAMVGLLGSYDARGESDIAKEFLIQFVRLNPGVGHAKPYLARYELANQNVEQALRLLEESVTEFPETIEPHIMLGDLLIQRGKTKEAKATYEVGLEYHSQSGELLTRLAQVAELEKKIDLAISLYERALEQNEDLLIARNNVAVLYADHRPTEDNLRRAITLMRVYANSKEAALLDTIGWLYYKLDDAEQAVRYLVAANEGGLDDPTLDFHLGLAYIKTGQVDLARDSLAEALRNGEGFEWIEEAKAALSGISS